MPEEGLSMAEEIEWFVGIDWASQSHQVCLVDARGECLGERAVAHGGLGIEELCDWLIARTGATPEVIGVAIEMTQGPVVEALLERGFCVNGINPKAARPVPRPFHRGGRQPGGKGTVEKFGINPTHYERRKTGGWRSSRKITSTRQEGRRGTGSSNPPPSSGEPAANLAPSIRCRWPPLPSHFSLLSLSG